MTETCVRLKRGKITKTRLEDLGKFLVSYEKKKSRVLPRTSVSFDKTCARS